MGDLSFHRRDLLKAGTAGVLLAGVGDSFYCWTKDSLKTQYGNWLIEALKDRFGEELVVFLDRAGYFYTRDLWEHVSGKRATELSPTVSVACVRGDDLDVWYFPPKLPELNPLEGCWDRLKEWFKHRSVPDSPTLKAQIQRGLPTVEEPNIWNYLGP